MTYAQIAEHFGVAPTTVSYWKTQGAPITRGGPNDLAAIEAWHAEWSKTNGKADQAPDADTAKLRKAKLAAEARDKSEAAKIRALKRQMLEGGLVDAVEIEALYAANVIAWRDELRGPFIESVVAELPEDLQPKLRPRLRASVERFLKRMADQTRIEE